MPKVILKYPLYKRPQPTNEVKDFGFLAAGETIEVLEVFVGKTLDGISVWNRASDGFYYWSGGINFDNTQILGEWSQLSVDVQKAILTSIISDKIYPFEKKVTGYKGYGWGYKNDNSQNGLSLTVFVDVKTATSVLNKTIFYKGFNIPIDVKEVNRFQHHQYINHQIPPISPDIFDPMQMGGSISVRNSANYGSRSLILKDKFGGIRLMSCFHVLLPSFKAQEKFPIHPIQDIFVETPSSIRNPFRITSKKNLIIKEGRYNAYYDFAMVGVSDNISFDNTFNNIDFNGFYLIEELNQLIGETIVMAGATSILQSGKVLDVKANIEVNEGHFCKNIIVTEMISKGGDSGAPVIDQKGKLVGIIVAGNELDRSLILPITYLFTQLGYQLQKK